MLRLVPARNRRAIVGTALAAATALLLVGFSSTGAWASTQATFYASPSGSGSTCSASSPCSLATAKSSVEALEPSMSGDLVVQLAGGTYPLSSTLSFGSIDSGKSGHSVVFEAGSGATPILSGGTSVTGWSLHDSGLNIWQASIPTGATPRQLYVNGQVAQLAEQSSALLGTWTQTSTGYTVTSSAIGSWSRPSDLDFDYPGGGVTYADHGGWTDSECAVASVSGTSVTMQQPCFADATNGSNGPGVNIPTYIENNYALLSQPGQFYAIPGTGGANGTVYYIPRSGENMSSATVVAPELQKLVEVNGTPSAPITNLELTGLSFEYANWVPSATDGVVPLQANDLESGTGSTPTMTMMPSAVEFHSANTSTFSNNTLAHLGGGGVSFDGGGQSDVVTGNSLSDIAGNGISIGVGLWPTAGPPSALENGYAVDDNYVHNVANRYLGGVGIFAGYVDNTTVDHNEVWDLPYTGISLGWGWNAVSPNDLSGNHIDDNYVHDVMSSALYDGGGIYVIGPEAATPAPTIENNYVSGDGQHYGAIYLDGGSSHWLVENNVVGHVANTNWLFVNEGGVQEGENNTIESNYSDSTNSVVNNTNTVSGNSTGLTSWPSGAQSVMQSAGLESSYVGLLGGPEQSNLAYGAAASASTTLGSSNAAGDANDGDPSSLWSPTGTDTAAYWQVNLGAAHSLSDVQVQTRLDIDQSETRQNFAIWVSNTADMSTHTVVCSQGSSALPYRATLDCPTPSGTWQYVRVVKTDGAYFTLNEVRVYGALDSNVALGASATASSTYSSGYSAAMAVDGNIATGWSPTGADTSPQITIDLGSAKTLSQFQLVTRQDLDQSTTRQNFAVWVSNTADMSTHTVACSYGTPALPYQSTYSCSLPAGPYRYVAVVKTANEYFFASEIKVFGH